MRRFAAVIALLVLLFSAHLQGKKHKKPKEPKDWTGHKISEVVVSRGAPDTVYDDPETKLKVFVWQSEDIWTAPGSVRTRDYGGGVIRQRVYAGQSYVSKDSTMFWVDAEGTITKWKQDK